MAKKPKPRKPKPKETPGILSLALVKLREAEREFHRQTVFVGNTPKANTPKANPARVLTFVITK